MRPIQLLIWPNVFLALGLTLFIFVLCMLIEKKQRSVFDNVITMFVPFCLFYAMLTGYGNTKEMRPLHPVETAQPSQVVVTSETPGPAPSVIYLQPIYIETPRCHQPDLLRPQALKLKPYNFDENGEF